jgi:RNA polymerase sigma-32 factor
MGFDLPEQVDDNNVSENFAPAAYLSDETDTPELHVEQMDWKGHQNQKLKAALAELDDRSQDIIALRWLAESKTTLQELAEKYKISAERVRQLENSAIKKLKAAMMTA